MQTKARNSPSSPLVLANSKASVMSPILTGMVAVGRLSDIASGWTQGMIGDPDPRRQSGSPCKRLRGRRPENSAYRTDAAIGDRPEENEWIVSRGNEPASRPERGRV